MSVVQTPAETLPVWAERAVLLLKPALGVMAGPVIINNIKRVAADPLRMTPAERDLFLEKVRRGIVTFAASARADELLIELRRMIC